MPKLTVDGIEVEVAEGETLLHACEEAGAEIPRFCYHERLSVAGNCRMCLVEVEKSPKPIASCAMPVADGMVVHTKTPTVIKARKGVMEFLLINHPLDCPICDQGGECDLQDQAMAYGVDTSRFGENKRAVEDKYMGPLVKTIMTRCIHCTRCVRFVAEVGGVDDLGAIGRGEDMEISTWLEKSINSELSGNIIDLCPVGALTAKPYAFTARPWELRKTETIDVMDAAGSNIRIDARGREVMRILPRVNDEVNEEWISDKTRFVWDGLKNQRLDQPYVRDDGVLRPTSWGEAFERIAHHAGRAKPDAIAALAGDMVCGESVKALKDLMVALGSPHRDCRQDGAKIGGNRANYLFNSTIAGIEKADALLLVGSNPRYEAPVINARLRKRWRSGPFPVSIIGGPFDLTYEASLLGAGPEALDYVVSGTHSFYEVLKRAERPMIILGMGALARADGAAVFNKAVALAHETGVISQDWNGFNVLHTAAGRVTGLDLGFLPGEGGRDTQQIIAAAQEGALDLVYLLGVDEIDMEDFDKTFVIYQGSHGDRGAHGADVILPGVAYTEKDAIWVNTEGRVQYGKRAVSPPGEAREDWRILRTLSEVLGHKLPYDTQASLRDSIIEDAPHFAFDGIITTPEHPVQPIPDTITASGLEPFVSPIVDFYFTNPIARASVTMSECSRVALEVLQDEQRKTAL
ncbi:MAG: NADH-quinone oxidoreductase subunit NuoG [Parvularculales bacterium]